MSYGSPNRVTLERCSPRARWLSRRGFVQLAAVSVAGSLAGCGGSRPSSTPEPVSLGDGRQCDVCGMVIQDHPGPAGQIFYSTHSPEGHANPAWFDTVTELFSYHFAKTSLDWEAASMYVTDYSTVDYSIDEHDGTKYISSFVYPESFAPASDLVFVTNSAVQGAMRTDLLPFSVAADAASFVDTHGGEVIGYGDIDQAAIAKAMRR